MGDIMNPQITPAALRALADGELENAAIAMTPGGIEAQEAAGQKSKAVWSCAGNLYVHDYPQVAENREKVVNAYRALQHQVEELTRQVADAQAQIKEAEVLIKAGDDVQKAQDALRDALVAEIARLNLHLSAYRQQHAALTARCKAMEETIAHIQLDLDHPNEFVDDYALVGCIRNRVEQALATGGETGT